MESAPSFPFTCRLLFIISTHKSVISRNFLNHNNYFEPFLSPHFLFREIHNLNLTFTVCHLRQVIIRDFKIQRRVRQRERQKTKTKTTGLPSFARLRHENA